MLPNMIAANCYNCGKDEYPLWNDPGSTSALCTDCYLRSHGYDPDEVGRRFAELARVTFADLINGRNEEPAPPPHSADTE